MDILPEETSDRIRYGKRDRRHGVKEDMSKRLDGIGEYYFSRRLREIAVIEAATGRRIIKLAMGSPDLPPAPCVVETLCETAHRPDVHRYMSYRGVPILRRAFADWYNRHIHSVLYFL